MYVIVKEDDCRPGLPLWVSSLLHVLTEKEAREEHGLTKIYGQADVLMLVMMGTTWKVWLYILACLCADERRCWQQKVWVHVLACLFTALLEADVLMLVMMGTTWKVWLHVLACLFTALVAADVLMLVMMGTTWKEWLHVLACLFYCVAGS